MQDLGAARTFSGHTHHAYGLLSTAIVGPTRQFCVGTDVEMIVHLKLNGTEGREAVDLDIAPSEWDVK